MSQLGTRTRVIVVAGSLALASTAYGIGSQTGDGTSDAAGRRATKAVPADGPRDPAASLAKRLGVSEADLRAAFDDIRKSDPPPSGDPRARFEKSLADALGLDQSKVADALDQLRSQHEAKEKERQAAFAKSLAGELGIDAGKVTAAFDKLRPEHRGMRMHRRGGPGGPPPGGAPLGPPPGGMAGPPPGGPGAPRARRAGNDPFLTALAKEIGANRADLRAALDKLRPAPPKDGGPPAEFVDDLAKALGVDRADVRAALEKVRSQVDSDMQARRDKLASELADRLDLPVDKVKDALAAGPFGVRVEGHGGPPPGGPLGPGPGGPMGPPPGGPPGP
jgi:Clp amino terminal domain, pathogenicity island component